MKIGIATTDDQVYPVQLFYYLLKNSIRPEFVVIVKRNPVQRIVQNLNVASILGYLKSKRSVSIHKNNRKRKSHVQLFLEDNGIELKNESIIKVCRSENIKLIVVNDINSDKSINMLTKIKPDILINAGAGIYKQTIVKTVSIGILNAHMGFLPYFRGMNVLEWSLFYDRQIGVTVHFIDKGIDTGDILMFKKIQIESGDTVEDLRDKSGIVNLELLSSVIESLSNGSLARTRQLKGEGKQFFVMHPRLKNLVEKKLMNQAFLPK